MNKSGMEKLAEAAKEYADLVLKAPLEQLGGILSDSVGYWRLKNRVSILLKTKQLLSDKGIHPGSINPDIFVPLLEDGGNIENEEIQQLFANLLATHLSSHSTAKVHPSFSKVLAQFAPGDAKLLLNVALSWQKYISSQDHSDLTITEKWVDALEIPSPQLSLQNLVRLGILWHGVWSNSPTKYALTRYGEAFIEACTNIAFQHQKES